MDSTDLQRLLDARPRRTLRLGIATLILLSELWAVPFYVAILTGDVPDPGIARFGLVPPIHPWLTLPVTVLSFVAAWCVAEFRAFRFVLGVALTAVAVGALMVLAGGPWWLLVGRVVLVWCVVTSRRTFRS